MFNALVLLLALGLTVTAADDLPTPSPSPIEASVFPSWHGWDHTHEEDVCNDDQSICSWSIIYYETQADNGCAERSTDYLAFYTASMSDNIPGSVLVTMTQDCPASAQPECSINVDGVLCQSCALCGDWSVTGDCTNLEGGLMIDQCSYAGGIPLDLIVPVDMIEPTFVPSMTPSPAVVQEASVWPSGHGWDHTHDWEVCQGTLCAATTIYYETTDDATGCHERKTDYWSYFDKKTQLELPYAPVGVTVTVHDQCKNDSENNCTVAVDGELCQACSICEEWSITADCTNLKRGLMINQCKFMGDFGLDLVVPVRMRGGSASQVKQCQAKRETCSTHADCCGDLSCHNDKCRPCAAKRQDCTSDSDCCGGLKCNTNNKCVRNRSGN